MTTERYFIAIIPPHETRSRLHELKLKISVEYNTNGALRSPPHLTLFMPFIKPIKYEERLIESLVQFANTRNPFELTLKGFGSFEPRVFYVQVNENQELHILQKELQTFMRSMHKVLPKKGTIERPFKPHLTLAFRDLKKQEFYRLENDFKAQRFHSTFYVSGFTLLKHDGKRWQEHYNFSFRPIS